VRVAQLAQNARNYDTSVRSDSVACRVSDNPGHFTSDTGGKWHRAASCGDFQDRPPYGASCRRTALGLARATKLRFRVSALGEPERRPGEQQETATTTATTTTTTTTMRNFTERRDGGAF